MSHFEHRCPSDFIVTFVTFVSRIFGIELLFVIPTCRIGVLCLNRE